MGITREQVEWVYRTLLQREPESEDVITQIMLHYRTRVDLIISVMDSDEFKAKSGDT